MTISVSTCCRRSCYARFGDAHAARTFELERLANNADRQNAGFASRPCDDRRGTGTGTAAHSGCDEDHVSAGDVRADFLDRLFRRRFTDLGPRPGAETFRQVGSELNAMLRARGGKRLRIRIGDDEFNALQPGRDHVVDGVATGAADADDRQPRFDIDHLRQL